MKKIYTLLILLIFINEAIAQNSAVEIEWSKIFGSSDQELLSSALKTSNDELLFAYQSFSETPSAKLMKLDMEGNQLWENEYPASNQVMISDIVELPDGDFVIVITSEIQGFSDESYAVKRISSEGEEIWSTPLQELGSLAFNGITLLLEEEFILVHSTWNLFKIDLTDGAHLWTVAISDPNYTTLIPNFLKSENRYIHISHVGIYIWNENLEIESIKLFPNSNTLIELEQDQEFFDFLFISKVIPTSDGGFLAIGLGERKFWNATNQVMEEEDGYLGVVKKFNADLELDMDKAFSSGYSALGNSGFNFLRDGVELSDGHFILIGGSANWETNGADKNDLWMFEIDPEGEEVWTLFFGGSEDEDGGQYFFGTKLIALSDEDFIVATHTKSADGDIPELSDEYDQSNIWIFKTSLDRLALDVESFNSEKFTFYPNPTADFIHFDQAFQELSIYNLSGQLVKTYFNGKDFVDLSELSPGIYLLQTKDENGNTQKHSLIKK